MKLTHKEAITARAQSALNDMYHNATPRHPKVSDGVFSIYLDAFDFWAQSEIEYVSEGLGATAKEWSRAKRLGFTHNERYFWLVSRITEYGKLYTYGRSGRTLAPHHLVKNTGIGFRIKDTDGLTDNFGDLVELIQVVEAFNHYVEQWNSRENLKALWEAHITDNCPGCDVPVTEEIWTTPAELLCSECKDLLTDAT